MKARVGVYGPKGVGFTGYLPTIGLEFSDEVGGGGSCTFEALRSDMDALAAWDAVLKVGVETSPGVWTAGPAYATRRQYTRTAGFQRLRVTAAGLLQTWAEDAMIIPEFNKVGMMRGAGTERGIGWMSSSYDPATDPDEPWDAVATSSHPSPPPFWPTGTGAQWIRSTDGPACYFRAWVSVASKRVVEFYLSADESATLWVGAEKIIETSSVETGYKEYTKTKVVLGQGTYAVAVYSNNIVGEGSGDDAIMCAAAVLDSGGDPESWVVASNTSSWVACGRAADPPGDVPPGPTPGKVLRDLAGEAVERFCSGWPYVTFSFTGAVDSYGAPWADIHERLYTYGHTSYWDVLQSLAESDEVDAWMGANLQLHAAPKQGRHRTLTLTETHLRTLTEKGTPGAGTWVYALAWDGWLTEHVEGAIRREYALELGEALTRPTGRKIARASLRDGWRWDASASLNPPKAGWIPYLDFGVGDWMTLDYQDVTRPVSVVSISAKAGEGGLLWDVELTEYPVDAGTVLGVAS